MKKFKRGWWWSESSGSLANEVEALQEKNDELQEKLKDMEFWKELAIKYRDERNTECVCGQK